MRLKLRTKLIWVAIGILVIWRWLDIKHDTPRELVFVKEVTVCIESEEFEIFNCEKSNYKNFVEKQEVSLGEYVSQNILMNYATK